MRVGDELGRLGMRRATREYVRHRLAFVRRERRHIDERLHLVTAGRPDDGAGIGVTGEDNRPSDSLKRPVERRDVVLERRQRQGNGDCFDSARRERRNHLGPTRSVGPGAMDEHDRRIVHRHSFLPKSRPARFPSPQRLHPAGDGPPDLVR